MKHLFISASLLIGVSCKKTTDITGQPPAGSPVQKGLLIHHANAGQCYGKAIATDAADNFIVAELFQSGINGKVFTSAGPIDALFSKYDKNGNLLWDRTAGGTNSITTPHGVGTDAAGNVYVTGYFGQDGGPSRTISFNGSVVQSQGGFDVFAVKYTAEGNVQWAFALGNTGGTTEERAWDIAVDASGNSYICGAFSGSVNFNPLGSTARVLTSAGSGNSIFLAKYDANGINHWVIKADANLGAVLTEAYAAVDTDQAGNVILGGNFRNTIRLGATDYTSAGNTDIFVLSCRQTDGSLNWSKTFGGAGSDILSPGALRVNGNNETWFTGRFQGTMNTGGGSITSVTGAISNMYLLGLSASGITRVTRVIPSASGQSGGHRVDFDQTGNVYITGWYSGSGVLNSIPLQAKSGTGSADIALCKFNTDGVLQWFNCFGAAGFTGELNISAGLAVDSGNNLLITGKFYGTDIDWDPAPSMELKTSSAGADDGFTAKFTPAGLLWQRP